MSLEIHRKFVLVEKTNERCDHKLLELDQQKSQSQINDFQPIYKARALHDFCAETNKELSFKKGDTILVKRRINEEWLEGEHQDLTGIFPGNYVELFSCEKIKQGNYIEEEQQFEGEAIVKYDFIPEKTFELLLRKGDRVALLRKLDNNWYKGRLNHIEGIFPAGYVEILKEPKDNLSNQVESIINVNKTPKRVLKKSTRLQPTTTEKIHIVPELSLPMQKCQVLYDYTPRNPDELEIHVGDIISIIEMCDDGWYCGVMEKSNYGHHMEFGTFPGNYVKLLPT